MTKRQKRKLFIYIVILIIAAIGFISDKIEKSTVVEDIPENTPVSYSYVHFLDVGQGDCTLIETHDGKFGLIDTSTQNASYKILNYLENEGVEELEFVLFTHPHEDHIGCGDEVLENFNVKTVYMNDKTENTAAYRRLINAVSQSKNEKGTKVLRPLYGNTFFLGDIRFDVLSDGSDFEGLNDSSICLRMELGKSTFIFTGDAEKIVERSILEKGINVGAEVFKLGHHGSSTSNSDAFLDAVSPDIAITSCGIDNDYGHPHDEIIDAMNRRGIIHRRTDLDGDILLAFSEDTISILKN